MSEPERPSDRNEGAQLEAEAAGNARVYQAGRDQHFHYRDGVRGVRRVEPADMADECPYPGLASFGRAQARWFFGRDGLTADLVSRLSEILTDGGPLMVVAPSGAGKSSLLQAGLLPALRQGALPAAGSRNWPQVVFTPTAHPMREAVAQIAVIAGATADAVETAAYGAGQLTEMLRSTLRARTDAGLAGAARAVIVVDQLEELFALCTDEEERRAFVGWLWQVADASGGENAPALVICGLRADFYAGCANYPQLRAALQAGQVLVGPMSEAELREAILYPAQAVGLDMEAGLAELLLRDLGITPGKRGAGGAAGDYAAGRLPLLAHALQATWRQRHGSTLTVDGYQATGGIQHAISTTAERVHSRLDPAGQREAATLFLRLVKIGDSSEDVRRRVSQEDLLRGSRHPDSAGVVLDSYTDSRLLTRTRDAVEITHEALIRAWPRLRQWIEEDRAGNLIRQELEEAAGTWNRDHHDKDALWRGSRLQTTRQWAASPHQSALSPAASAFLSASNQHERRTARLRRGAVAGLVTLTLLASGAAAVAFQQQATAQAEHADAIISQITAQGRSLPSTDVSLAAQLDAVGYRMRPSPDLYTDLLSGVDSPLSTPLTGATGPVESVAFSPDGDILATGSLDGTVRLWDIADPARPVRLGPVLRLPLVKGLSYESVRSLAFSPGGQVLASGNLDSITLWNIRDAAHPSSTQLRLSGVPGSVYSVAFSPDGHVLAGGGSYGATDGAVRLWDVAGPARELGPPVLDHHGIVNSVAFSPHGHILAAGGLDGFIRLWNVTDPARPAPFGVPRWKASTTSITSVAFSPDGHTLVSAGLDAYVRLWNITSRGRVSEIGQPAASSSAQVYSAAFSPDGETLATTSGNAIQLWTVSPAGLVELGLPLTGHTGPVLSVAFSQYGRTLASGSSDDTARLWTIPPDLLTGNASPVTSVAFSPRGHILASGLLDGAIQLWNLADPTHPAPLAVPLQGDDGSIKSVAFSPNGRILAAGTANGTIQLWDITDPVAPTLTQRRPSGTPGIVDSVAFNQSGQILAAGSSTDGTIQLWDIGDPAQPTLLGRPLQAGQVLSVAFSPDGRMLASAGGQGIQLWNIGNIASHPTPEFTRLTSSIVWSVAFSPDGHVLASGSTDATVRLWNVSDPARLTPIGPPLIGHSGIVFSVAFSPGGGHILASGSADATVRLWNVSDPDHATALGQPITGSAGFYVNSVAFSPDGQFLAGGSNDGAVRLWPTSAGQAIRWICTAIPEELTHRLWHTYLPELAFNPPCATVNSGNQQ